MGTLGAGCFAGPVPNSDISGIGVRISFYAQASLLALLSARSPEQAEITDALTTLVVTNLAYGVTTLYLGFRRSPQLSLYDALVVVYLLLCSWTAIFFTLPRYNRFRKYDPHVKLLAILQSYLVFAITLSIFVSAPTFGNTPQCNGSAKVALFGALLALHTGRLLGLAGISVLILLYTATVAMDYQGYGFHGHDTMPSSDTGNRKPEKHTTPGHARGDTTSSSRSAPAVVELSPTSRDPPVTTHVDECAVPAGVMATTGMSSSWSPRRGAGGLSDMRLPPGFSSGIDGTVSVTVLTIVIVSALAIVNTELLRLYNHPQPDDSEWSFGQILPMFFIVLPLKRTIQAFWSYGLGRRPRTATERGNRIRLRPKTTVDVRAGSLSDSNSLPDVQSFTMPSPAVISSVFMDRTDSYVNHTAALRSP